MPPSIAILGAGNIGTAFATLLARHRRPVFMYSIEEDVTEDVNQRHQNKKYLPHATLQKNIYATSDLERVLRDADTAIIAVPNSAIPNLCAAAQPYWPKHIVVGSLTKGLDEKTRRPTWYTIADLLPPHLSKHLCLIAGPAVANEIVNGVPTGLLIAAKRSEPAQILARLLENEAVKATTSNDVDGVGYAMALKNIYAIGLGLCDGLRYPINTKAFILTIAMQEMACMLRALGGKAETALSLAGIGDLITTSFSSSGRNRTYGERLVGSATRDPQALGLTTVEGLSAHALARPLIKAHNICAPLFDAIVACVTRKNHFEKPFVDYLKRMRMTE